MEATTAVRMRGEGGRGRGRRRRPRAPEAVVDGVNRDRGEVERVRRFAVLDRPLSIETGKLTPTLKVRRRVVEEHFRREIEALYRRA